MITNPARFALLPVILLASPGSVSAKEQIVPAICESAQTIAVYTTRHPGKAASVALLFDAGRQYKDCSPSCASCYMQWPGGDDQKTGYVRSNESGRVTSLRQGISDNKRDLISIDREVS